MDKLTKEMDIIRLYKKDYQLFSTHKSTRDKMLIELKQWVKSYEPFIKMVTLKGYGRPIDKELRNHTSNVENFLHENFPEEVCRRFRKIPTYDLGGHFSNIAGLVLDSQFNTRETLIQRNIDRTIQQEKFLKYVHNCLKDNGLHPLIENRPKHHYSRYWIAISHKFERKIAKKITNGNLIESELLEQYVTPYLERTHLFLDGQRIPFADIKSFKIARLLLSEDELPLFKEKHGATTDLQIFNKALNVTSEFITTKKVNENYALSKEIMGMVQPKFQKLIKNKFKIQEYSGAYLKMSHLKKTLSIKFGLSCFRDNHFYYIIPCTI